MQDGSWTIRLGFSEIVEETFRPFSDSLKYFKMCYFLLRPYLIVAWDSVFDRVTILDARGRSVLNDIGDSGMMRKQNLWFH